MRLVLVRLSLLGLTVVLVSVMFRSAHGQGPKLANPYAQGSTPHPEYTPAASVGPGPLAESSDARTHGVAIPPLSVPNSSLVSNPYLATNGQAASYVQPKSAPAPTIPPPPKALLPPLPPAVGVPSLAAPSEPAPGGAEAVTILDEPSALPEPTELMDYETQNWWQPWAWFPLTGWENSIEFGINGSEGNASSFSFLTGADLKRATDRYELEIDFNYLKTTASGELTQHNAFFGTDYDHLLGDSNWSAFVKFGLEYDAFKAFDLRLNTNTGLGYYWVRSKNSTLVTRVGAGASREYGGPNDSWSPEAVFGLEAKEQITKSQRISAKLDYYPEWGNFNDYRLVTDVAWESLLGGSENLSLKVAATDRIDSTPEGRRPNDVNYSLLLLYKF